jgi:hypothetical protein
MKRRLLLVLVFMLLLPLHAWAALTSAQRATLAADIAANPTLNNQPHNSDGATFIQQFYATTASPNFTVWKTSVPIMQVGNAFDATELGNRTTLENTRLQTLAMYLGSGVNPSLSTVRQFFDDIFSGAGGVNTRTALLALWKRLANRGEKLFATGTGSDVSPATMVVEGTISVIDIMQARGDA